MPKISNYDSPDFFQVLDDGSELLNMQLEEVNGVEIRQRIENLRVPVALSTISLNLALESCLPVALELAAQSKCLLL